MISDTTNNNAEECKEELTLPQEEKITKDNFKYDIGDVLGLQSPMISICSPANPNKEYKEHLRVVFRFWDGGDHVYIVEAEDGIGLFLLEKDAVLEHQAPEQTPQPAEPKGFTEDQVNDLQEAWKEAMDKRDKKIDDLQRENFTKQRRLEKIDMDGEVNTRLALACLNSVEAMLSHSMHGATHRERNFYTEAMIKYIDKVRDDIRMPKSNDEYPF